MYKKDISCGSCGSLVSEDVLGCSHSEFSVKLIEPPFVAVFQVKHL